MAEQENLDCLDQALDDMDNKLNLTADEKDNGFSTKIIHIYNHLILNRGVHKPRT